MSLSDEESSRDSFDEYDLSEEEELWHNILDENLDESNVDFSGLSSIFTDEIFKVCEEPRDSDDSLYYSVNNHDDFILNDPSTDCTYKDVMIKKK